MRVLCFLSGQKWVFRPAGATRCHVYGGANRVKFHVYRGRNVGVQPQNYQIWNFAYKFAPQRRLICTIFMILSAFVRVYGSF